MNSNLKQHLILGGARSGKSRYAEQLARHYEAEGQTVFYFATAQTHYQDEKGQSQLDIEMQQRIEHHQSQRPAHWQTIEAPVQLAEAIQQYDAPNHCLLVDCLTLWTLNLLHAEQLAQARQQLLKTLPKLQGTLILVSNEVGLGVVPLGELSRQFVDELGWLHQKLAEQLPQVTFMIAGQPLTLKDTL